MADFILWLRGVRLYYYRYFLVDIIHNIPSLQAYSSYSWVIVGLAAIPSAPVWTVLLEKFSAIKILFVAYILQVVGILLPVLHKRYGAFY